jgi:hypothetical protein
LPIAKRNAMSKTQNKELIPTAIQADFLPAFLFGW